MDSMSRGTTTRAASKATTRVATVETDAGADAVAETDADAVTETGVETGADATLGSGRVRRLSSRRRATRERLLTAARTVFLQRGVALASVEEICEQAGFTRGAFYSNFSDKHELIEAMLVDESARILQALTALGDPAGGAVSDLADVIDRFFAVSPLGRRHYLIHTELTLLAVRDPQGYEMFRELTHAQFDRLSLAVVAILRRAGLEPTVPTHDFAEILYGVLQRSVARALLEGRPDADSLARRMLPAVIEGLTRPLA